MITSALIALAVSFSTGWLILRSCHLHARFSMDHDTAGVQKFHSHAVPRIGGVLLMAGLLVGTLALAVHHGSDLAQGLVLCSLPVFASGIAEDLTKKVGPLPRLLAAFVAAACSFFLLDAGVYRLDVPLLDTLLAWHWLPVLLFTMLAVGGVAHSINIIDGYNGLSSGVGLIIFAAYAFVSWRVGDQALLGISLIMMAALAGFLFWNFPRGKIFAGDGGAYLVGYMIAVVGVLLVRRHEQVSAWFPLVCVAYPVFETLFSIFRRRFLQARSVGQPDALHLHQMVYRRLVRWRVGSTETQHKLFRNALTSPYMWLVSMVPVVPAVFLFDSASTLFAIFLLFALKYVWLYWRLVRFRSPRWMILYRPHSAKRARRGPSLPV
ncbi:glycosyl transferase [Crenobacter luteus]|uniref:Glycosyl transferase n=1 Tax=Crenobacter luteus TaxID=1452487 RepID=A0A161SG75_9NEIS|nr:glycosyl transferase [Crenobacter luteus]